MPLVHRNPAPARDAAPAANSSPLDSSQNCAVEECLDGSMVVTFRIEPTTANRIKKKAYLIPVADFLYDNVLKRAVETTAF